MGGFVEASLEFLASRLETTSLQTTLPPSGEDARVIQTGFRGNLQGQVPLFPFQQFVAEPP